MWVGKKYLGKSLYTFQEVHRLLVFYKCNSLSQDGLRGGGLFMPPLMANILKEKQAMWQPKVED